MVSIRQLIFPFLIFMIIYYGFFGLALDLGSSFGYTPVRDAEFDMSARIKNDTKGITETMQKLSEREGGLTGTYTTVITTVSGVINVLNFIQDVLTSLYIDFVNIVFARLWFIPAEIKEMIMLIISIWILFEFYSKITRQPQESEST